MMSFDSVSYFLQFRRRGIWLLIMYTKEIVYTQVELISSVRCRRPARWCGF